MNPRGGPPGRHSSYTPSPGNRGGKAQSHGGPNEDSNVHAGDIITGSTPVPQNRGNQRSLASSLPMSNTNGARKLPKFGEVANCEDEPTPPERSPHVSPRISNLPALPPRPGSTSSAVSSVPAAAPSEGGDGDTKRAALRHKCLEEIYQTEKDYIDDLETLISVRILYDI